MGEPAVPPESERRRVLALAQSIVDSVRNDEEMPTKYMRGSGLDGNIFRLAQDLVDTRRALDNACAWLEANTDKAQRRFVADKMRRLDFEPEEQPK